MRGRRHVLWDANLETREYQVREWLGIEPMKPNLAEFVQDVECFPLLVHLAYDPDRAIRHATVDVLQMHCRRGWNIFSEIAPLSKHPDAERMKAEGVR